MLIHQNFPGQFKSLAPALSEMKNIEVQSLSLVDSPYDNINHYKYNIEVEETLGENEREDRACRSVDMLWKMKDMLKM